MPLYRVPDPSSGGAEPPYNPAVPEPLERIETSGVQLDAALVALSERLAAHVHDLWIARRTKDGWTHGPRRDDARREHPGLVAYENLSESEKDVDRQVARGVLEALVALGYRITPPR
jgi:hypothetical protein